VSSNKDQYGSVFEKEQTYECAQLALVCDLDGWLARLVGDCKWPVLHIALDFRFVKFTVNKMFGIENGVLWVGMEHRRTVRAKNHEQKKTHRRSSLLNPTHNGVIQSCAATPHMRHLYNMGARRLSPSLPGSVFCVVDTLVRMQSSMTARYAEIKHT